MKNRKSSPGRKKGQAQNSEILGLPQIRKSLKLPMSQTWVAYSKLNISASHLQGQ
jgi:hypothetical protein